LSVFQSRPDGALLASVLMEALVWSDDGEAAGAGMETYSFQLLSVALQSLLRLDPAAILTTD
jgi:hypothetical protein